MSLFEGEWTTNKSNRGMIARKILVVMVSWSMGVLAVCYGDERATNIFDDPDMLMPLKPQTRPYASTKLRPSILIDPPVPRSDQSCAYESVDPGW
jgi:hypothetical protein